MLLFIGDTLIAPLWWLEGEGFSYELFENSAAEESSDDAESQKEEKKNGSEEFVISGKTIFIPLSETDKLSSFIYYRFFKSRVNNKLTPPPELLDW